MAAILGCTVRGRASSSSCGSDHRTALRCGTGPHTRTGLPLRAAQSGHFVPLPAARSGPAAPPGGHGADPAAGRGRGGARRRPCRSWLGRSCRPSPPSTASRAPARCWRPQVMRPRSLPPARALPAGPREEALRRRSRRDSARGSPGAVARCCRLSLPRRCRCWRPRLGRGA